ncbi:MAG: D-alanyl-D-alanine carboxypeptidase [Oscillospiraceae bacterium]|nr:D-alanyl-D-alanine carboxypeptidase [Oscillospiraceae bacterium]
MSIWKRPRVLAAILAVVILMLCVMAGPVRATETVPEETVPEVTEPKVYTVDTESEVYKVCEELAATLEATQILVYDTASDEILYSKTVEGEKLYPASITKLFSCYVALQYLDPDEIITAGDELDLVAPDSSMAYIYKNQMVKVKTVVEAMMLPSGNDAAQILAAAAGRRISGDESLGAEEAVRTFVQEMNRMAEELGFEKSHFMNPDGYHVGAHYTCIKDMARIAKLALENKTISRYMRLLEEDVVYASGQTNHWKNTNKLLDPEGLYYRTDAIGMKTGRTSQAGYSLMSAFKNGDSTLVIGIFGCPDENARFRDSILMVRAVKDALKNQ